MLPVEVDISTHRRVNFSIEQNDQLLKELLDFLDEKRDEAKIRTASHRQRVVRHSNMRVRSQSFVVGDLVLKRIFPKPGVFGPNWEGPYVVEAKYDDRTYKP